MLFLYLPSSVSAQDTVDNNRFSLVLQGVPLEYALEQLVSATRMDLAYYPSLVAN